MQQRAEILQPQPGHSLDRLYDIPLEVARLHDLPEQYHREFLDGQTIGLLNEHAGYVPHSEVEGELGHDGRWTMQGLDLEQSWQRTIDKYGQWSREHYEVIGYKEAHKLLLDPDVNMVALSSPSKEGYGDRSFSFVVRKIPNSDGTYRIIQTNIMHRHDDVSFEKAQERFDALQQAEGFVGSLAAPETAEEMLVRPLAFKATEEQQGRVFEMLGLTQDKVEASEAFTKQVREDLGAYTQHFIALMSELQSTIREDDPIRYAEMVRAAQQARDYLFEQAELIREDQDHNNKAASEIKKDGNIIDIRGHIAAYYDQHEAPRFYGSLVCDTEASGFYGGLLGELSPHMAALYTTHSTQSRGKEAWRDTSTWQIGACKAFGKGGCGAEKIKVGPCAICEHCQRDYDAGRKPSMNRAPMKDPIKFAPKIRPQSQYFAKAA
jgi:hypothetical protein